jgi:hypothetical protein
METTLEKLLEVLSIIPINPLEVATPKSSLIPSFSPLFTNKELLELLKLFLIKEAGINLKFLEFDELSVSIESS